MDAVTESQWKSELEKSASRYHIIGGWVAIIFDPIFAITDYLNIPDGWLQILILRISVAIFTLIAMQLHKRGKISTYLFIAVPLFLISIQNAYTYSLIGPDNLLGHNLNYLALFLGAGLFILWPLRYSLIALGVSMTASFGFIFLNESLDPAQFAVNGGVLLVTAVLFSILLIQARYNSRVREIKARLALANSLAITEKQRDEIEAKNDALARQSDKLAEANSRIADINAQLQYHNEKLEVVVGLRTEALRTALSERNQMVYRLSHDFRHPVVNIRALLGLMQRIEDEEKRKAIFERIYQAMDHFDDLVRDMEKFPVYARPEIKPAELDPEILIGEVWESFQHLRNEGDEMVVQNHLPGPVTTDEEKLRVIFQVLLANSLRYRNGEAPARLSVDFRPLEQGFELSVQDDGSGIEADTLPRVFEMFFRGDGRSKGAGLGLYLARGLARQLGGDVTITSESGHGTLAKVTLS